MWSSVFGKYSKDLQEFVSTVTTDTRTAVRSVLPRGKGEEKDGGSQAEEPQPAAIAALESVHKEEENEGWDTLEGEEETVGETSSTQTHISILEHQKQLRRIARLAFALGRWSVVCRRPKLSASEGTDETLAEPQMSPRNTSTPTDASTDEEDEKSEADGSSAALQALEHESSDARQDEGPTKSVESREGTDEGKEQDTTGAAGQVDDDWTDWE